MGFREVGVEEGERFINSRFFKLMKGIHFLMNESYAGFIGVLLDKLVN